MQVFEVLTKGKVVNDVLYNGHLCKTLCSTAKLCLCEPQVIIIDGKRSFFFYPTALLLPMFVTETNADSVCHFNHSLRLQAISVLR